MTKGDVDAIDDVDAIEVLSALAQAAHRVLATSTPVGAPSGIRHVAQVAQNDARDRLRVALEGYERWARDRIMQSAEPDAPSEIALRLGSVKWDTVPPDVQEVVFSTLAALCRYAPGRCFCGCHLTEIE